MTRLGNYGAAVVDAGAFAITYLAHFGIVYIAVALDIPDAAGAALGNRHVPQLSRLHAFRVLTGSILGSIVAHAASNLATSYAIFDGVLA